MRFGITGQHPKNPTLLSSERPLTGAQCLLSTTFLRAGQGSEFSPGKDAGDGQGHAAPVRKQPVGALKANGDTPA
jgi:hypothetical protein